MFVSSVDRSDPNKNIIFEIAPNGTLMGVFAQMTDGLSSLKFNINPTAILIPPVQDQSFLSGLIGGSGISSTGGHVRRSLLPVEQLLARSGHQQRHLAHRREPDRTWAMPVVGTSAQSPRNDRARPAWSIPVRSSA